MAAEDFAYARWRKPKRSGNEDHSACVEYARAAEKGLAAIRDSKLQVSPVLVFTDVQWSAVVRAGKAGRLNPPTT
ncbi:DUF397 domain-containing protein [Amycolatopsis lurida]